MKVVKLFVLIAVATALFGTSPAFATHATQATTLLKLAEKEENSSLRYLHTTWFRANYRYTKVRIASIVEVGGTKGTIGTIELLKPSHGFTVTSIDGPGASFRSVALALTTSQPSVSTTRQQASALYATALALANGSYNPSRVGVSKAEALRRAVAWTNALALSHARHEWGESWQSALWTFYLGAGSAKIRSSLPTCTQALVKKAVADEANRLLTIPPLYYRNAKGKIVHPGDSQSEEDAWNATLLFLAARMYGSRDATRAAKWEDRGRRYALIAYATPDQVGKDRRLAGSNLNPDGTVVNHGIIHPDYMATAGEMQAKYDLVAEWSRTKVAAECLNGFGKVWYSLTRHKFRAGKSILKPGGTIYRAGPHGVATANVYYPQGADWSNTRRHNMALMDVSAFIGKHNDAYGWALAHIRYVLAQQARHSDGRVFSAGESGFPEEEQFAAACAAEMVESLRFVH